MSQITYADKVTLNAQPDIADINKVTADDMNEIKTAHNDTDSKVSKLMNFDYCIASINNVQTLSSGYVVQLNEINSTNNNMFSLDNGRIVIGANVHTIKLSCAVFVQDVTQGNYVWVKSGITGGDEATSIVSFGTGNFETVVIPERIYEVQQGDLIYLVVDSPSGGNIRVDYTQTWVQVEKIN